MTMLLSLQNFVLLLFLYNKFFVESFNLIILYGPCDDRLFDVLHEVHRTLLNHVPRILIDINEVEISLMRQTVVPHMRHDLNNTCSWVTKDTLGVLIVSKANETGQEVVKSAHQYNVPYLMKSEVCPCDGTPNILLPSSPLLSSDVLEKAVFDFLAQEDLHDVLILHENGSKSGIYLSSLLNSASIPVSHLDVVTDSDFLTKLQQYFDPWNLTSLSDDGRRLIVLTGGPETDSFLEKLVQSPMQKMRTKLLVVDSPEKWRKRLFNVTAYEVDIIVISKERNVLQQCPVAVEVLPTGYHSPNSRTKCRPLSLQRKTQGQDILVDLQENLDHCCSREKYNEYTIWKSFPGEEGIQTLKPIGIWSPFMGFMRVEVMDVTTIVFRIAILEYPPYIILNSTEEGKVTLVNCVFMEILEFLHEKISFEYTLVNPLEWGFQAPNGDWTGAVGMVLKGEADIIPFFTVTPTRAKVIDYSGPVATVNYGMLVATPSEPPRTFIFLRPFTKVVWIASLMAAIIMSIVLYQVHIISQKISNNYTGKKGLANYSNCLWCIFSAMVQQSGIHLPETISARLVLSTWWLAVLVIISTYSANLIAFLAFPEAKWVVRTLEDLAGHKTILLMIDEGCPVLEDLHKSDVGVFKKIREVYLNNPKRGVLIKASEVDVVQFVHDGQAVYVDDVNFLSRLVEADYQKTGKCRITIAPEQFSRMITAMGFRRGSSILPTIDKEIKQMWEGGVLDHWKAKYSPQRDECLTVKTTIQGSYEEVKYTDVQGAFHLLILGIATCVAFLAWEVIRQRLNYVKRQYYKVLN